MSLIVGLNPVNNNAEGMHSSGLPYLRQQASLHNNVGVNHD